MKTEIKAIKALETSLQMIIGIITGLVWAMAACLIMTYPTMWLWNWLMPVIFNLPKITDIQALGLLALSTLLIKK